MCKSVYETIIDYTMRRSDRTEYRYANWPYIVDIGRRPLLEEENL